MRKNSGLKYKKRNQEKICKHDKSPVKKMIISCLNQLSEKI